MFLRNTIFALLLGIAIAVPSQKSSSSLGGYERDILPLQPRAAEKPLEIPSDNQNGQVEFMKEQMEKVKGANDIPIRPQPEQLQSWKVKSKFGLDMPISATSVWIEFGKAPETFKMRGLTGCTATIIVSPHGMWAGHLWEGSVSIPNAGAFRGIESKSAKKDTPRNKDDFRKIAVDIMGEKTLASEVKNRKFVSLGDLKQRPIDPFDDDVSIFVLTKADGVVKGRPSTTAMYSDNVNQLKNKYCSIIRRSKYVEKTYIGDEDFFPSDFPKAVAGVIIIQYTPFQKTVGGKKMAAARVWYEDNPEAVIDKEWETLPDQQRPVRNS